LNNNPLNIVRMMKEDHLILHTEHLKHTLHREDVKEKAKMAHKTLEYRKKMGNWAKQPEVNKMLSKRAKKQWKNSDYKLFMIQKFKEFCKDNPEYVELNKTILNHAQKLYWSDPENRKKASEKVKTFFNENPDARVYLSDLAKEQWENQDLIEWRIQKTKEQWTPEFRKKRKKAYNKTYYDRTIQLMKKVLENNSLEKFDEIRIKSRNKSVLSMDTFCSRFFNDDVFEMLETVKNYNHKIKKIEFLDKKIDVYDLEVKDTHNFALASGVFVHNSAKMARNKEMQAILPLKGKILNVEKSNPIKSLSSEEIANIVTAVGTGVGDQFDITKVRYNRIIIMSDADVDGEHIETLLLTFFFRYMKGLIDNGKVYSAYPPLYRIRKGQKDVYVYSDEELKKATEGTKSSITRFKGLGEMNPQQLWDTTMNPKTRKIKSIYIEDAVEADKVFSMLMGDDVQSRKQFIQENAKEASLDV
ncbi:MAG: intein-containing DNA gyrase subunit B, partial [Nanoarchaeota archaeon]|nr:intein-containing DNA gyrase subunit B [Nanoarchaeota archaeon]